MYPFALVWHILSKGQLNRGEENNKLLIKTSQKGDHRCVIVVTAKYRSVFTIIKGSYLQDFCDHLWRSVTGLTGMTIEAVE